MSGSRTGGRVADTLRQGALGAPGENPAILAIPQSVLPLLILAHTHMSNQPFALEAFQGIDELRLELDTVTHSESVESLAASRGILVAVAICVPFWTWVYSILF